MTTAAEVLAQAAAGVGTGADPNYITRQYGPAGWGISKLAGGYDWCAVSTYVWSRLAGDRFLVSPGPFVSDHVEFHQAHGTWLGKISDPQPGDEIMFDWDQSGNFDHIGYVESVSGGQVHTIEGNNGDAVRRRSYALNDPRIAGYGRPNYSGTGTAGLGSHPIEEELNMSGMAIVIVGRPGVGKNIMFAVPGFVSLSREISAISETDRAWEIKQAQTIAEAVGLGKDYKIPEFLDAAKDEMYYTRSNIAYRVAGMPWGYALTPSTPWQK